MNVEIDDDYVDNIVAQSLRECYENMVYVEGMNKYSLDREEELERIYEMRKALRLVHNHYCLPFDRIEEPSHG